MFNNITILIIFLWAIAGLFDYANLIYIWQLKEYRMDRFKDFLHTKQSVNLFVKYNYALKLFTALIVLFWPMNNETFLKYLLIGLLVVDITYSIFNAFNKKNKYFTPTLKSVSIMFCIVMFEILALYLLKDWSFAFLLLIIRFFAISIIVYLFSFPTKIIKKFLINYAEKKIKKYENLIVIGITGSYGKSTVKEFLAHILSSKFNVIKTPKNINTEIGIAKFILKNDFYKKDVFIVEMGAYCEGEIKLISNMVRPKIGILTAINEQHLSLFGSIEKTQKAKYELLKSLPIDGLAITNSDNEYCRANLSELNTHVKTFGYDESFNPDCRILYAKQIFDDGNIICEGIIENQKFSLKVPILGIHNSINIAPCILAAKHLGVGMSEIIKSCETLKLPDKTLQKYIYGKAIILDDSYNANPDGFKAALDVLASFPSGLQRIVITRGMLELGEKSDEIHEQIGGEIDFIADQLVIVNEDYSKPLQRGVVGKYKTDILLRYNPQELLEYVAGLKNKECVVLIENRIPGVVYQEIINNSYHAQ
jgi:UDP-N-acetylmuramoyl-tripeptide--D-alanyl-D-alanine ligase